MSSNGLEPVEIIDPWLYATFSGDAEIVSHVKTRITDGAALGPTATPFITWTMNSSRDIQKSNGDTLWNESLYLIKVVGQGASYKPLVPIAKRMNTLLDMRTNVPGPNGGVLTIRRDRLVRYPELDDNIQYRHLGAIWRITAHS